MIVDRLMHLIYQRALSIAYALNEFILDFESQERIVQIMDRYIIDYEGSYNERRQKIIDYIKVLRNYNFISRKFVNRKLKPNTKLLKGVSTSQIRSF